MKVKLKRGVSKTLTWTAILAMTAGGFSHFETLDPRTLNGTVLVAFHGLLYFLHEWLWSFSRFGIKPIRVFISTQYETEDFLKRRP